MPTNIAGRAVAAATSLVAAATFGLIGVTVSAAVAPSPAAAASSIGGQITRSEILARATNWFNRRNDADLTYSQELKTWDGPRSRQYRRDCSGFVGMAWHVDGDPWTGNLANYADPISTDDLLPGDALNDSINAGRDPDAREPYHVILFGGWENAQKTRFWYYSFGGTPVVKVTGASFSSSMLSSHPTSEYRALRYRKVVDDKPEGKASVYGVLSDGRLTYSVVDASGVRTHGAVVSAATLGFAPKAMAVLDFNTILITSTGGDLYRVDVTTNGESLVFKTPVRIADRGWTLDSMSYDGSGHLYGIVGGALRRYNVTKVKPGAADITGGVTIGIGFTLKTLTTTGPDRIIGTTADGRLRSYKINAVGLWDPADLRLSTWQVFDQIVSAGGGVYLAQKSDGSMYRYHDADPFDGNGDDISSAKVVDAGGWTQVLLSAQPGTIR